MIPVFGTVSLKDSSGVRTEIDTSDQEAVRPGNIIMFSAHFIS